MRLQAESKGLPLNSQQHGKRNLPKKQCFREKEPLTEDPLQCALAGTGPGGGPAARASGSHTRQARVEPRCTAGPGGASLEEPPRNRHVSSPQRTLEPTGSIYQAGNRMQETFFVIRTLCRTDHSPESGIDMGWQELLKVSQPLTAPSTSHIGTLSNLYPECLFCASSSKYRSQMDRGARVTAQNWGTH